MAFFNSDPGGGQTNLSDQTDAYVNKFNTFISFLHIPSDNKVFFKAMVTTFSDSFTSQWSGEDVYGRADPIQIFKSTKRSITLGFDVVASTDFESWQNLSRLQSLAQFLYPSYTGVEAQTIAQAPLVRVGFMNMITDNAANALGLNANLVKSVSGPQPGSSEEKIEGGDGTEVPISYDNVAENGLVCAITSLNYSSFGFEKDNSNSAVGKGSIMPRVINVSLSLEPIHRHQIGWLGGSFPESDQGQAYAFPYGEVNPGSVHKGNLHGGTAGSAQLINKKNYDARDGVTKGIGGSDSPRPSAATLKKAAASGLSDLIRNKNVLSLPDGLYRDISIDTSNISSGMDFLNNPTDPNKPGVLQTLNQRQLEKQGTQQQIDMANARYNSLGGQIRYNRDKRIAKSIVPFAPDRDKRAKQNIDASGQTLSDFDQPIDIGYSPTRGDYS